MKKYVYKFAEGNKDMRELLGGKGANLAEMARLGFPVPNGFTITTEACTQYYEDGREINKEIQEQINTHVAWLEKENGKKFGDPNDPLLVSVRSGARASMPGMMDTILNLGLNDIAVKGFAEKTQNPRFAYDSYRRFIQMYSDVVMEVSKKEFESKIDALKAKRGVKQDIELTVDDLQALVYEFKMTYKNAIGKDFPQDPKEQLMGAIKAVFRSWDNPRANVYRKMNDIPYSWGTAVNVQTMVFGNKGNTSGTGVAFSRNPATGEPGLIGEYLMNAQGEDVVAGVRTPEKVETSLKENNPSVYQQLLDTANKLEQHYHDMQDMEFTVQEGKLYMLQTRNGKRTAAAALRIACDLVDEGMIDEKQAVLMIEPKSLDQLLHPQFDNAMIKSTKEIGCGLNASPGAAAGKVVFNAEDVVDWVKNKGEKKVVLVRLETSPEDIVGMQFAQGVLTVRGGMTSHAAVVARGMGACCVCGCGNSNEVSIDEDKKYITINGVTFHEGDWMSLDGTTGKIYDQEIKTVPADVNSGYFGRIMHWADKYKHLEVRTNADTPKDAKQAFDYGATGIGLCRTEHMFFKDDRIPVIREMICADTVEERKVALDKLLPMQQSDFEGIYEAMEDHEVTIRLLDPPLHEFVPTTDWDIKLLANAQCKTVDEIKNIIAALKEFNPMMGHRGCRLSVTYPEITEMQTRAIMQAAIAVKKKHPDWKSPVEIMVPLVGEVKELKFVKDVIVRTAQMVLAENNLTNGEVAYKVGTMIEIPRAALTADEIAKEAEFFSFGTNDLTQMTFGFSRDDAGKFLGAYYDNKIYEFDPFAKLDQVGVGKLVEMAVKLGTSVRPGMSLGICGEHGGDPSTIEFCHKVGLTYVSCSPFRVPIARLAAAQAAIKQSKENK